MQILKDFLVGLQEARLVIGNVMVLAESPGDVLRFFQLIPGDGREKVMLDLIVETPIPEIGEGVRPDIARTEHLLMQKV